MGHTKCGAVTAACNHVELGNITPLLQKIKPAVVAVEANVSKMDDKSIEDVAVLNVELSIDRIRKESSILSELEKEGTIEIFGAIYDVSTGKVNFL